MFDGDSIDSSAVDKVVDILLTRDSEGNYPIDNKECRELVAVYAEAVCKSDPNNILM